jgi:hypothetical protein
MRHVVYLHCGAWYGGSNHVWQIIPVRREIPVAVRPTAIDIVSKRGRAIAYFDFSICHQENVLGLKRPVDLVKCIIDVLNASQHFCEESSDLVGLSTKRRAEHQGGRNTHDFVEEKYRAVMV